MDISDEVFLAAVDEAIRVRSGDDERPWSWATRWDVAAVLAGHPEDVGGSPVEYAEMPERLLLARVDERAKAEGKTRADMLRDLVSQAIG